MSQSTTFLQQPGVVNPSTMDIQADSVAVQAIIRTDPDAAVIIMDLPISAAEGVIVSPPADYIFLPGDSFAVYLSLADPGTDKRCDISVPGKTPAEYEAQWVSKDDLWISNNITLPNISNCVPGVVVIDCLDSSDPYFLIQSKIEMRCPGHPRILAVPEDKDKLIENTKHSLVGSVIIIALAPLV